MIDKQALKQQLAAAGKVAVLAGGHSSERAISLQSGQAVLNALLALGVDAQLVDPVDMRIADLRSFDRAFIALHGPGGEDGTIQGLLDYLALPYTGSGVLASAIGMDKLRCKWLWQGAGLPTPAFWVAGEAPVDLGFPVMVKPATEGSSIGMSRVDSPADLPAAIKVASEYDKQVIIEQFIRGAEFTVALLNGRALPSIRLETDNAFFDYNAKYERNDTRYSCPSGLSDEQEAQLQALALKAFDLLDCRHWGRVDVMQNREGDFFLLEVNTVPGMTSHSLVPMAAKAAGLDFDMLVGHILLASMEEKTA